MKLKHIFLFALLLQGTIINATIVQKLLLKNGSELEGYISMQRPGQNFNFTAERAIIYKSDKEVKSIVDHEINIKQLSPAWKEWAINNDAFEGLGDNRILVLSDIITDGQIINRVRVLEKGAKIKYLEMSNNTYSLNWDTIAVVKADKRSKTALTGINRIYKLENGEEYEGQYVEEVPGKTLSLFRDNGVVEVFETANVVKYSMRKINPNQGLFEQSELLDIIQLKGNKGLLKGIIIEQNFSHKAADNYLLLQTETGITQSVKLADIEEYRKEINPKYKPLFDILLREGELVINREQTNIVKVKEEGNQIILQKDTCITIIEKQQPATNIVIETRLPDNSQKQILEIVKVKKFAADKKNKDFYYGFTFEDIVKSNIQPHSVQTSVNKTTKFEYTIAGEGLFAIYNSKDKTVIPLRIK